MSQRVASKQRKHIFPVTPDFLTEEPGVAVKYADLRHSISLEFPYNALVWPNFPLNASKLGAEHKGSLVSNFKKSFSPPLGARGCWNPPIWPQGGKKGTFLSSRICTDPAELTLLNDLANLSGNTIRA
ncbi:hypothetical protein [Burkholderia stagnalis]